MLQVIRRHTPHWDNFNTVVVIFRTLVECYSLGAI